MEDLEEKYAEGIEKEEEIFLGGLQNNKSLGELEKEYSRKVKEIRRIYEKSLKKDLNEEKEKEIQKAKNKTKSLEKEEKEFHVQNLKLENNWKEQKQIEIASWEYRTQRKINDCARKITPNSFVYTYYKIKRIIGDFSKDTKNTLGNIWEKVSESISSSLYFIKEGLIKIITDIGKISNIFKRKSGKEKKEVKENATKKSEKQAK